MKILTAAGRDEAYARALRSTTRRRSVRCNGWSIDAGGASTTLRERDAIETTVGDFELYTDTRMKVLKLPARIGSIVAFEYERNERAVSAAVRRGISRRTCRCCVARFGGRCRRAGRTTRTG